MSNVQKVNWLGTHNNPDVTMVEAYLQKWFTETEAVYVNG